MKKILDYLFPSRMILKKKIHIEEQLKHLGGLWGPPKPLPSVIRRMRKLINDIKLGKYKKLQDTSNGGYFVPNCLVKDLIPILYGKKHPVNFGIL